jgi:hypothetical protein
MHQLVFAAKDYYTVDVRPKNGSSVEDLIFPLASRCRGN